MSRCVLCTEVVARRLLATIVHPKPAWLSLSLSLLAPCSSPWLPCELGSTPSSVACPLGGLVGLLGFAMLKVFVCCTPPSLARYCHGAAAVPLYSLALMALAQHPQCQLFGQHGARLRLLRIVVSIALIAVSKRLQFDHTGRTCGRTAVNCDAVQCIACNHHNPKFCPNSSSLITGVRYTPVPCAQGCLCCMPPRRPSGPIGSWRGQLPFLQQLQAGQLNQSLP